MSISKLFLSYHYMTVVTGLPAYLKPILVYFCSKEMTSAYSMPWTIELLQWVWNVSLRRLSTRFTNFFPKVKERRRLQYLSYAIRCNIILFVHRAIWFYYWVDPHHCKIHPINLTKRAIKDLWNQSHLCHAHSHNKFHSTWCDVTTAVGIDNDCLVSSCHHIQFNSQN